VIFAAVTSAVLLYLSLRGIDWHAVSDTIGRSDYRLLAICAAIATGTLMLRAWRWCVLLRAAGPVSLGDAFWATAAGVFGNTFLPARAGEVVRAYMISGRGLPMPFVLATALAERVVDAVILAVIASCVLFLLPDPPGWLRATAKPFAILGLVGAITIVIVPFLGPRARWLIELLPFPPALKPRLSDGLEQGLRGMRVFHDPGRITGFIALALAIWGADAAGTVIGGAALGISISPAAALLLIAGLSLGSALPATPGYVGVYQFVAVTVLSPFGLRREEAIAYILVAQALMLLVVGMWGGLALMRRGAVR
jgi:uncharacterized protein (TIRG00374 family)